MTSIVRLRVAWSGSATTGPGLSTFYTSTSGSGLPAAVKAFYTAIASLFPPGLTWTIPNSGDLIEDTTGELAGTWSEPSGGGTVLGSTAAAFVRGAGIRVKWPTSGVRHGRRVVGSTFLTSAVIGTFDNTGTLTDANVTTVLTAAQNLRTAAPTLRILSKPSTPGGNDGTSSLVNDVLVPDQVTWLRSRRT